MKGSKIVASLAVAAAVGAAVLGAGAAAAHERGRGGSDFDARGGWGGRMLDFDAVAGAGAEAVDRGTLVDWGVQRLGALDTNGDGTLDRQEIAAALPDVPENPLMVFAGDPTEARVDRFLAMFDAEAAGGVAVETVVARQADRLFRRLDRNNDGSISRQEAEARPGERGRRHRRD